METLNIPEELKCSYAVMTVEKKPFNRNAFIRWHSAIILLYHPINNLSYNIY